MGFLIFLTKWKDLGDGPESEVWTRHLSPRPAAPFREAFCSRRLGPSGELRTQGEEDRPQVELIFRF